MRLGVRLGAIIGGALLVAACGNPNTSGTSSGTATTATSVPPPAIVSPSLLNAGTNPTTPRPPLGNAGNPGTGAVADAQHMADFVLGPWEVDEKLVTPYLNSYYVLNAANALQQLGPETVAAAAGRHGFVDGFASAREETDKNAMINAVLRFTDPAAAAAAITDMNDAVVKQPIQGATPTPAPIPGHPEAVASTYPFTPHGSDQTRATVRSFTAHGPYVLMQFVQSIDGLERATGLVAKAIDAQGPVIDQFKPADPGALADVPLDPTGLLAKTLPTAVGTSNSKNAVYGARGAMHFQSNPVASTTLFKDTGVTEVAMGKTNVYQAKDANAAVLVINAFGKEISAGGTQAANPVPALPASRCQAFPKGFYCVAPAGRYAIEAQGDQLVDVQQQVAAQYVILTAT